MSDSDPIDYPDTPLSVALVNSNLSTEMRAWALQAINDRRALRAQLDATLNGVKFAEKTIGAVIKERDEARAKLAQMQADGWEPGGLTRKEYQQEVTLGYELRMKAEAQRDEAAKLLVGALPYIAVTDAEGRSENVLREEYPGIGAGVDELRSKIDAFLARVGGGHA